jgi:nucleotide-binding universal stress UspA family protein
MAEIVCAIRAGAGSRTVQSVAIREARAADAALLFLHVIDQHIVASCEEAMRPFVRNELYWMGKTLARIAVARAHANGLTRVAWAIREGDVREEIARAVSERQARLLLIGAPRRANERAGDPAADFAAWVTAKTGVSVAIVAAEPAGQ